MKKYNKCLYFISIVNIINWLICFMVTNVTFYKIFKPTRKVLYIPYIYYPLSGVVAVILIFIELRQIINNYGSFYKIICVSLNVVSNTIYLIVWYNYLHFMLEG